MAVNPRQQLEALHAATLLALTRFGGGIDLSALSAHKVRDTRFSPGQTLCRQGQDLKALYVLREGTVKIHVETELGREQITAFRRPGEIIGLDALNAHRHMSTATAVKPTLAEEIPSTRLWRALQQEPQLATLLLACISKTLAESEEALVLLGAKGGLARVATFLLIESLRQGSGSPRLEVALDMSRTDIGHYLGLSKEATVRLLKSLEDQGLIRLANKHVAIRHLDALCEAAGVSSLAALEPVDIALCANDTG